jgi:hypothetical protein
MAVPKTKAATCSQAMVFGGWPDLWNNSALFCRIARDSQRIQRRGLEASEEILPSWV